MINSKAVAYSCIWVHKYWKILLHWYNLQEVKKENMDIVNILSLLLIIKKNVIITLHWTGLCHLNSHCEFHFK